MKKKSRKNRRVLFLLLMMLTTGTFLTTATFAWFTANKSVAVSDIDVNIAATEGIQVSADGSNWKSIVNVTDLTTVNSTYASSINQIPAVLEPVSSPGTVNLNGRLDMFAGTVIQNVPGENILTAAPFVETRNNAAGKFVAFDLFFRLDGTAKQLNLTTASGVTFDTLDTGIKNGARGAFVILGNTPVGTPLATIQALNSGVASPAYIWEPNYNSHTAAGISNALDTYGIVVGTDPVPYDGISATIINTDNILLGQANATDKPTFFTPVTPDYTTIDGFTAKLPVFTLQPGITKMRIYFWIEGQDVDVENSASGGNITYSLQFSID